MNINAVRLVSIRVIQASLLYVETHGSHIFLNTCVLMLLSLATTYYCSSDLILIDLRVNITGKSLLNQACAGCRMARTWFLKIDPVWIVSMCVCVFACVSAPEDQDER